MIPRSIVLALALAGALALPAHADLAFFAENPWTERRVLHIAHQGGELEAPSETLFALKTALEKGADVLEVDVHATADRELVVLHDATVDRTTNGEGRVDAMTLVGIKALDAAYWFVPGLNAARDQPPDAYIHRGIATGDAPPPDGFTPNDFTIPTLREVLETFPDILINIEIKATAPDTLPYEHLLADLLEAFDRGDDTIVVSFLDHATELFRAHNGGIVDTAVGTGEAALFWATAQGPGPGSPSHHQALQVPIVFNGIPVVDEDFVARAHANGLAVHVWTVDDPDEMRWLIEIGVDGIMTASPTVLEQVLQEEGVAWDP